MTTMPLHNRTRSRVEGVASARLSGAEATGPSARPIDAGEVPVAPGVVEIERLILEVAVGALRRGEPARIWMPDVLEPHDVFPPAARDAFHGDLGDAGDHQLALATMHREFDLDRFGSQLLRDHRPEQRGRTTRRAGENRFQCGALFRVRSAIDIDCEGAAALRHRPRSDERLRGVEPRNVGRAVVSLVDAEREDHIAMTLSGPRGCAGQETWAQHFAVTRFEILALDFPRLFRCAHLIALPCDRYLRR